MRDVELGDVSAYVRMRCDPAMMAELGGPLPREGVEEKVARDVRAAAEGTDWIKMIVPDEAAPEVVAGNVALWSRDEDDGEPISEIGWMVLPEFQGRGLGKRAVRMLLELAGEDGRWGLVHAFPATTNAPSNGIWAAAVDHRRRVPRLQRGLPPHRRQHADPGRSRAGSPPPGRPAHRRRGRRAGAVGAARAAVVPSQPAGHPDRADGALLTLDAQDRSR